ncbi:MULTISPECIES: alpha/beta fold hydrolase [Pseudomonas]|uniref:alpha/beta fold hydrolase n=1 Tax=Pseudomonas TaxID=286 RepID=UPI001BE647EA|nr:MULTISPECIES: alpha/beta hydrolase [Pseudomonas]MBT2338458.1 alpha/beta hydrolase [Pseudomonas fluorescens]MCD4531161.1 alpha/beta hydrolase [Pseudomonas sp. C3-2018]
MNAVDHLLLGTLRLIHRRQFGLKLRWHTSEQGRLAYLQNTSGRAGPTLVILHGLGASKDQWGPAILGMARHYPCVFVDLPGHGQSLYESAAGYGPQALLAALEGLLEKVVEGPFVLVGSSLGGCVAGLYAAKYPQRVSHLVLLAPAGLGSNALGPMLQTGLQGQGSVFGYRTVEEMRQFWSLLFQQPPQVGGRLARAMAASGKAKFAAVQRVIKDFRREGLDVLLERLPQIASRTLVIWGRHDQVFLPATLDQLLQQLPDARGQVIEDSGHVPYLERGNEVVAAITGFISPPGLGR